MKIKNVNQGLTNDESAEVVTKLLVATNHESNADFALGRIVPDQEDNWFFNYLNTQDNTVNIRDGNTGAEVCIRTAEELQYLINSLEIMKGMLK